MTTIMNAPTKMTTPARGDGQKLMATIGGPALANPFAGIPLSQGYNPRPPERCRILLIGERKQGKSSFLCSDPDCCVLDFEGGCDAVPHALAHVIQLSEFPTAAANTDPAYREWFATDSWTRYEKAKAALLADAKSATPRFCSIGIDSVDAMYDLVAARFCIEKDIESVGDYKTRGAGYSEIAGRLMRELDAFDQAGYGFRFANHLVMKMIGDGQDARLVARNCLVDSARLPLLRRVDQIMQISATAVTTPKMQKVKVNNRVVEREVGRETKTQVTLRTVPVGNDRERGCRVEIPDKLILPEGRGMEAFATAYRQEVERRKNEELSQTAVAVTTQNDSESVVD